MHMFQAIKSAFYRWKNAHPKLGISISRLPLLKKSAIRERLRGIRTLHLALRPLESARIAAVSGEEEKFEIKARAVALNEIERLQADTRGDLQSVQTRITRLGLVPGIEPKSLLAAARERQESATRSWAAALADMKRMSLRAYRALAAFRRENPPVQTRSVRSHNLMFVIPGILAVAAAEMWINAQILLDSGGHTPAEILTLVVFTSLFNMFFGLMIGTFGIHNMGHVQGSRKFAGFVIVVAGAALVVALAYWMAMYRNAIESALDDPAAFTNAALRLQRMAAAKAAIRQTMQNDPFAFLGHLHAVLIFVLGLLFGTVAALEGYHLLGDYPGYKAADRLYLNARDGYERAMASCQADFAIASEELTGQLDAVLLRAGQRLSGIKTCLDAAAGMIERYEKSAATLEHDFIGVLIEFQAEYVLVRGTQGPARWQQELPLLNPPAPSFSVADFVEIEERAIADLQGIEDDVAQIKTQLSKNQEEAVSRLKVYLQTVDIDQPNEEEIALNELFGVRIPAPPDAKSGYTGAAEEPATAF